MIMVNCLYKACDAWKYIFIVRDMVLNIRVLGICDFVTSFRDQAYTLKCMFTNK